MSYILIPCAFSSQYAMKYFKTVLLGFNKLKTAGNVQTTKANG